MAIRTDLAAERCKAEDAKEYEKLNLDGIEIERLTVEDGDGSGLPAGDYVTLSFAGFTPEDTEGTLHCAIRRELCRLLKNSKTVLVAGLGNVHITPDALGPKTADGIIATRHISKNASLITGFDGLESVAVLAPGVLGQTGIEAAELIKAAANETRPDAVIVIDALAGRGVERLGRTLQITNAGICPGSGVGNSRKEISRRTLGVPVIAIGVPTVVDAATFAENETGNEYNNADGGKMMVTPRDIDSMIVTAARVISHAVNCALHPKVESDILLALS